MPDTKKLGTELGEKFARLRTLGSDQERKAKLLIGSIITRDPKIKLPEILADERVKAWQEEKGVTDGHLKKALTDARADLKRKSEPDLIKVPPRSRRRMANGTAQNAEAKAPASTFGRSTDAGLVPNRSLDLL